MFDGLFRKGQDVAEVYLFAAANRYDMPESVDCGLAYTTTLGHGEDWQGLTTTVAEGTGAYEGWTYIAHSSGVGPFMEWTVRGFVFPGDPPPMR